MTDGQSAIIAPTQDEVAKIRGYRDTQKWRDPDSGKKFTNYECVYCQYSTLYHDKIVKHVQLGEHPWAYPGQNPPELSEDDQPSYG